MRRRGGCLRCFAFSTCGRKQSRSQGPEGWAPRIAARLTVRLAVPRFSRRGGWTIHNMSNQSDRGRGSDVNRGEDMKYGERNGQTPAASPFTELNERSRDIFRLIV